MFVYVSQWNGYWDEDFAIDMADTIEDNIKQSIVLDEWLNQFVKLERFDLILLFLDQFLNKFGLNDENGYLNLDWFIQHFILLYFKTDKFKKHFRKKIITIKKIRVPLIEMGFVFWLLKRKEYKIFEMMVKKNSKLMMKCRDENGNDTFLFICGQRGKINKVVQFLMENNGCDFELVNNNNENYRDRCLKLKQMEVLDIIDCFK